MLGIILLVLVVLCLFLWLLSLLAVFPGGERYTGWLAWFTCLFLALAVFVTGWPAAVVVR
jgi:hypothetical protein